MFVTVTESLHQHILDTVHCMKYVWRTRNSGCCLYFPKFR